MTATITADRQRLAALEDVIKSGIRTFFTVGRALQDIRAEKLYRHSHATFADYCEHRWGFSRQHALRLMDAAEVQTNLTPTGVVLENEYQARNLPDLTNRVFKSLPPAEQKRVLEASEKQINERAAAGRPAVQVGGEGRAERIAQAMRLLERAEKVVAGLGDEAGEVILAIDAVRERLRLLPAA
jgi:hypothetical protein